MKIKAKTRFDRPVTIVGFVVKYDLTWAVVIHENGTLAEYRLDDLIVLEG